MTDERKEHDVPEGVIEEIENMQFWAFTEGWTEGQIAAGVSAVGLDHRVNAAEAYNRLHGTDHMGDMIRRIQAREAAAEEG